ncbi:MAG: LapA family protein [Peptococcaceae bacterium]|jgi:uncharacterized integral membrane protein|nr:LapA family protein [Peptococcaceae bacterium]
MFILVLALICALIVAVFALQNAAPVTIHFAWLTAGVPLVIVILVSTLVGAFIVLLLAIWREFRLKKRRKTKDGEQAIFAAQSSGSCPMNPAPGPGEAGPGADQETP